MSITEKKRSNKNIKYLLLFLIILLISLGFWKWPYLSNEVSKFETNQEQDDGLRMVKPDVIFEENLSSPSEDNEKKVTKKEEMPEELKSKERDFLNTNANKKREENLETDNEMFSKTEQKEEVIIVNEEPLKKAIEVSKVNTNIDKRSPATSNLLCKSKTILKITKSSIQTSVAFSPDGTNFAVGNHNNYVSVMNMEGKELLKLIGHKGYVQSIKYSPNGKFMATGSVDNTAKLWNASDGKEITSFKGHTEGILSVAYSFNGTYIATGSLDHTAILWNAKSGEKLLQLRGHKSEVVEVVFSMDSKFIMTGSSDGTAKLWDVKSGEILYSLEGHENVVGGVAFTPDNKLIATSSANKIRLWYAKTGKHIHTINGNKDSIMSIFISKDGKYITSSSVNGLIKVWKIKGGEEICKLEGHTTRAREAVFHPTKENIIVSASNDKTIRIWNFGLN